MSRSRKKIGILKDKGLPRSEYNRRFRRVNRQRVKEGKEPKLMREVVNSYCVCDWRFLWNRNSKFDYHGNLIKESNVEKIKRSREYFGK